MCSVGCAPGGPSTIARSSMGAGVGVVCVVAVVTDEEGDGSDGLADGVSVMVKEEPARMPVERRAVEARRGMAGPFRIRMAK